MQSTNEQKNLQSKYYYIPQRSGEWFQLRKNRMTASNADKLLTTRKLKTYISKIIADDTGCPPNEWMLRGIELEPIAKARYELETGNIVDDIGFITYGDYAGCSPDGLIRGQRKGIEIKCPKDETFEKVLVQNYLDEKYYAQIQMNMLITGYDSWDYVVYTDSPEFEKDIIIWTIQRDEIMVQRLEAGIADGTKMLKELLWLKGE